MDKTKKQLRAEQAVINRQRDFTCLSCSRASDIDYAERSAFCAGFGKRIRVCGCLSYKFRGVRQRPVVALAKGKVRA